MKLLGTVRLGVIERINRETLFNSKSGVYRWRERVGEEGVEIIIREMGHNKEIKVAPVGEIVWQSITKLGNETILIEVEFNEFRELSKNNNLTRELLLHPNIEGIVYVNKENIVINEDSCEAIFNSSLYGMYSMKLELINNKKKYE